jgi:hypothetical protein
MEKKGKITVYLPQKLYIEIYERHLEHHFSFLVSWLMEEFLKKTDVRISWREMPSKAEQREYLETKLREFFSQTGPSAEVPKPPVQEKTEPTYVQEPSKEVFTPSKPAPVKQPSPPPLRKEEDVELNEEVLRRIEKLW